MTLAMSSSILSSSPSFPSHIVIGVLASPTSSALAYVKNILLLFFSLLIILTAAGLCFPSVLLSSSPLDILDTANSQSKDPFDYQDYLRLSRPTRQQRSSYVPVKKLSDKPLASSLRSASSPRATSVVDNSDIATDISSSEAYVDTDTVMVDSWASSLPKSAMRNSRSSVLPRKTVHFAE